MVFDFPDTAKFLSDADRVRVVRRLKLDKQSSAEHEEFKAEYFWAAFKDAKTWFMCLIYMGTDGSLYAFSLFLPTIIASLGKYNSVQSQLLTIPPYAAATIMTILVGYLADRTRQRGLFNIGCSFLGIAGFAMLLSGASPGVSYAGTFLGACGIYPTIANTIAWGGNNVEGVYKRGVAMGLFIGWGNLNGVVSSNIYIAKDSPRYIPGHAVVLGYLTIGLLGGSVLQYFYLRRENRLRREGKRDAWIEGKTPEEIERLGDRRPDFIYTL
jgi:MFS family permease